MCGLVGVFGNIGPKEKAAFKWLLIFDTVRGEHSTGVLSVGKNHEINIYKELGVPANLFEKYAEEFPSGSYKQETTLLMGHNRFATQGKIIAENAHPFEFEHVVGAHNGTVSSWDSKNLHNQHLYEIDSQKIYSQLNFDGDTQSLWSVLEDHAQSAASLSYWDKRDNSFNLLRNSQRPMYVSLSTDGKTLFYASEAWMLQVVLERVGLKASKPEATEVHNHYKFVARGDKIVLNKKKVQEKKFTYQNNYPSQGNFGRGKFVELEITSVDYQAPNPYIVMKRVKNGEEVLCIPVESIRKELFLLFEEFCSKHMEVYEGAVTFEIDENYIYELVKDQRRVSGYAVMRAMELALLDMEEVLKEDEKELPRYAVATYHDGSSIQGRKLKRALEQANCRCAFCLTSNLKKSDIAKVNGGVFYSPTEFICADCVENDLYGVVTTRMN